MAWREEPAISASPRAATNAKTLRRTLTEPEKRLWWHLRHRLPVASSHFRRQVALGAYVVDFCCLAEKLIIEIDGGQHGFDAAVRYDARRDAALEAQGFRILRFTNAEVMRAIDPVLDTVFAAVSPPQQISGLSEICALSAQVGQARLECGEGPGVGVAGRPSAEASGTTPTSGSSPQGGGEAITLLRESGSTLGTASQGAGA